MNMLETEITALPPTGGLTGIPSDLPFLHQLLRDEVTLEKVTNLLRDDPSILEH